MIAQKKGHDIGTLVWMCLRANSAGIYQKHIKELRQKSMDAANYIEALPDRDSFISYEVIKLVNEALGRGDTAVPRTLDTFDNSFTESFNAQTAQARRIGPAYTAERIVNWEAKFYAEGQQLGAALASSSEAKAVPLNSVVAAMFSKAKRESTSWRTIGSGCEGRCLVTKNVPNVGKVVHEVRLSKGPNEGDAVGECMCGIPQVMPTPSHTL